MTKIIGRFKSFVSRRRFIKFHLFIFAVIITFAFVACRTSPKIDMRKFAPADAMVYIETNDVGEMLESLTESRAFQELAANKTDFSALENVQLAIVVTDFKTSEEQPSGESSVLNFKPQFVAIAETHVWSWQTVSLAENQINNFVLKNFGQNTQLEKFDKDNGKFFTWTTADNRQIYAFVEGSLIYFGNDAAAIEKCLAVKRGKAESLLKNESLTVNRSAGSLAFGYVAPAGIAQIAKLAGVAFAVQTTEVADERSFIARIVPQILQTTTQEIVWTANKTERGIEDAFAVFLKSEVSAAVNENLSAPSENKKNSVEFLPPEIFSATRYNLKNPLAAWRGLLLLTSRSTDVLSGKLLIRFSDSLLEPYGIANAEMFLNSVGTEIITAQFDENSEKSVVIAEIKNTKNLKKSITKEINFNSAAEKQEMAKIWFSADKNIAAAFVENKLILGDGESVLKCVQAKRDNRSFANNQKFQTFAESNSVAVTFGKDFDSAERIVGVLTSKKIKKRKLATFYLTETKLNDKDFERKTISDFGLIGVILKQLDNKY